MASGEIQAAYSIGGSMKYLLICLMFLISCNNKNQCKYENDRAESYKNLLEASRRLNEISCKLGIIHLATVLDDKSFTEAQFDKAWAECEKIK